MRDLENDGRMLRNRIREAKEKLQEARAKKYPHLLPPAEKIKRDKS